MRVARLWAGVDEGVPVLDPRLGRVDADTPKAGMLAFLGGGSEVLGAPGFAEDWLDPARPLVVPIGFRTDGDWLWSAELPYYLREHGVVPEPEFVGHMQAADFVAGAASAEEIQAAEELLRGG